MHTESMGASSQQSASSYWYVMAMHLRAWVPVPTVHVHLSPLWVTVPTTVCHPAHKNMALGLLVIQMPRMFENIYSRGSRRNKKIKFLDVK
jgi:hypothetical protein